MAHASIMIDRELRAVLSTACLFLASACGGGGGSGPTPVVNTPPPSVPTSVNLSSEVGDYIGAGADYSYDFSDAVITVTSSRTHLTIVIEGDESWRGDFQLPDGPTIQTATYENLTRMGSHDASVGGMNWTGEGRGCNELAGRLVIESIAYDGLRLSEITLEFDQYCDGSSASLHADIHWDAGDTTSPPGPVVPPPAGLWEPAAGATPDTGNYIYLESQVGDPIGQGGSYLFTPADALFTVSDAGGRLAVSANAAESWNGDFQVMNSISFLEAGYYPNLQRYPLHNPAKGGLNWSGGGRGCDKLSGWFVVDSVTYDSSTLTSIDLRFEQHCEGGGPALNGEIHWDVNDTTSPPGPIVPVPAGLWEPALGVTPAKGNYVYLESEPGDFVGIGGTYLYTQTDSRFTVYDPDAGLLIYIAGEEDWGGNFEAMDSRSRLEVGYYGDLHSNNPAQGELDWSGEGRGCNQQAGWFAVDSVTYDGDTLTAIDLRFEQHCEDAAPALYGEIHWDVNDTTTPPGPVVPAPAGLWAPAPGITPATASYVYMESEPGDYVGQGRDYLYTQADSRFRVLPTDTGVVFSIDGDENWGGGFHPMYSLSRLEIGYYADVDGSNPAKGAVDWFGEGRGCNTMTGWLVVDSVTYDGDTLTAIELRFAHHCEGGAPALYGEIHWDVDDTTSPPGPVVPPPAGLWEPPPGTTPATGNFVYLESEIDDYIGLGQNYLYTDADSTITIDVLGARLSIEVGGWSGSFQGMSSLNLLEVGYYPDLQSYPVHNPAKGGLTWYGHGRGCSSRTGWFVVDSVTYDGNTLTAIDLRFEQHCGGRAPALNGEISWSQ